MTHDLPTVSVITPLYNAARYVAECIQSVREQTFSDWEHIIVEDGSQDGSWEAACAAAQGSDRVRLLRQAANSGPAAARNAALAAARGRYFAFLDADDLWLPEKLERQLRFMQAHDLAISYTRYRRVSPDGSLGPVIRVPLRLTYKEMLIYTGVAGGLTIMLDRTKVGDVRMPEVKSEDLALWLSILRRGFVARGLSDDLGRYRLHGASVSSNKLKTVASVWNIYRNLEQLSLPRSAWCLGNYVFGAWLRNHGWDAAA